LFLERRQARAFIAEAFIANRVRRGHRSKGCEIMRRGSDEVSDDFKAMLQEADLGELLEMAGETLEDVEVVTNDVRTAFDEVARVWVEKAMTDGKHLAAVIIASACCVQDTVVEVAAKCLRAHTDPTDVERVLIWREVCGLAPYLAKMGLRE